MSTHHELSQEGSTCFLQPKKLSKLIAGFSFGLTLIITPLAAQEQNVPSIDEARTALEEWVETERIISKEKKDLALSKEVLGERIELVKQEIETLREKISAAEESIAEADKKRNELIQENDRLKESSNVFESILADLETRTKEIIAKLPDPISERIKPLTQRIPEDPDDTKLGMAQRFQNVVGVLNEINKFNREIVVTSEVRSLSDGTSAEVTAVYLGIGQAFYSGANGTIAGVGTATDEGWVWEENNEAAEQAAQAVSIMQNEQIATFVHIPVNVE